MAGHKSILGTLLSDKNTEIRALLAADRDLPESVYQKLVDDESLEVRRSLAGNPATPLDVRRQLIQSKRVSVIKAMLSNVDLEERLALYVTRTLEQSQIEKLAHSAKAGSFQKLCVRLCPRHLASNNHLPEAIIDELIDTGNVGVQLALVHNVSIDKSHLRRLVQSPSWQVRKEIAYRTDDEELLELLAKDDYKEVREAAVRRKQTLDDKK